ncbi:DNA cytosine methyltransferase [Brevibacillus laterosporus]|uniref:DNA cytosine methyltransferase n=1 Tax=Brevibacillus laterosporus TaxID=1465 RepID=UPI000B9C03E1|nr:DNA cytosine methyltransferase [Brevibacillus laterosporus]
MKVIDLFAGAGGLSEGFRQVGFDIVAHVEMDKSACNTLRTRETYYYLKNTNQNSIYLDYLTKKINRDILYEAVPTEILNRVIQAEINNQTFREITNQIDQLLNGEKVDLILGGPPCQAYSTAGISRDSNRMQNDPRNYLYRYYIKFLRKYKPKMFIFENVKGILTAKNGSIFRNLRTNLKRTGYSIDYRILNARDFGVSQNRERVILIGWKNNLEINYPEFTKGINPVTISELFRDLPKLNAGESINGQKRYIRNFTPSNNYIREKNWNILTQHITRPHNENDLLIYHLVAEAWLKEKKQLKYNELPEEIQTHSRKDVFLDRYKLVKPESISHTIVAHISKDGHYYIHPDIKQNRSLSVREAARIQSFPDNFFFEDSRTAAFRQIGNAVPPLMAFIIAKKIKDILPH